MASSAPERKRSWKDKYTGRSSSSGSGSTSGPLTVPVEGQQVQSFAPTPPDLSPPLPNSPPPSVPLSRTNTLDSAPGTPKRRGSGLTPLSPEQQLDKEASQLILNALERTTSAQPPSLKSPDPSGRGSGTFGKLMGALSLSRTSTKEDDTRGRSLDKANSHIARSSSAIASPDSDTSRSRSRARSNSPFTFRRFRGNREPSPTPEALPMTSPEGEAGTSISVGPRATSYFDESDYEGGGDDAEMEDDDWSGDDDTFDPVTEANTEQNSIVIPPHAPGAEPDDAEPDPLGEGVNVVVPREPYFPSTLNSSTVITGQGERKVPRRRKSTKHHEPLPLQTSRPSFQRDRCTITLTQGDPEGTLGGRRKKKYIVASDLSEESRYAVEWGIGTVLRDGDEMTVVTVIENESKVDPKIPNAADRAGKLRSQQERQGLAYILVRQVTGLLQRTRLNVKVSCQSWHAKNSRHMLLGVETLPFRDKIISNLSQDIVDYVDPTMLIVGSRGLGQLKGILLGSTSHYLIQKCSVPVMVARRRLKRPAKHSAHLATHRTHVSLAEAGIDRVAPKVDQAVKTMRDEIERDDEIRGAGSSHGGQIIDEEMEEAVDEPEEDEGAKVAG